MNLWQIGLLVVGVVVLNLVFTVLAQAKKPVRAAFGGILRGLLAFGAVNLSGLLTGITLPVSVVTLSWSALTGIPGVITLMVLEHLAV